MSVVKVFVSYSHADLTPRPGYSGSRVGQILNEIKHELNCHSSRSHFKILRDVEQLLQVSQAIHKRIDAAIAECDLGLVLLSENYCASDECIREFDQLIGLKKTLFLVETEDFRSSPSSKQLHKYTDNLREILSARFWGVRDQKAVRFGWPMPQSDSEHGEQYNKALDEVVRGLKARANEILAHQGDVEAPSSDGHYTVFLAWPTKDVKPETERLERILEKTGATVLRIDPELITAGPGGLEGALTDALGRCDIYVQLLGDKPGRPVDTETTASLVPAQYQIAARLGKPIHTWRRSDFDVIECGPDYAGFLNGIISHVTTFEEFAQYIVRQVKDVQLQRASDDRRKGKRETFAVAVGQGPADDSQVPLVAIDVAQPDNKLAREIAEAFGKHVDVTTLPFDLDNAALSRAVADHDAIILGYGPSEDGQKRAKAHFMIIHKKKGERRAKRFNLAVGDAAPDTAPPCPKGPDVQVISVKEKVDEAAMLEFLNRLGVSAERVSGVH